MASTSGDQPLRVDGPRIRQPRVADAVEGSLGEGPETEFTLYAPRRTREIELWIRFHPAALPATCELRSTEVGEPEQVLGVELQGLHSVHHALSGFGPGSLGVHWTWHQDAHPT